MRMRMRAHARARVTPHARAVFLNRAELALIGEEEQRDERRVRKLDGGAGRRDLHRAEQ
jgi:hypothetical protein